MRDYKELRVWKSAHQVTLDVYRATAAFPKEERYGLTSQLRRSCASIPSNLAEGAGRDGDAEMRRFLFIALGSANETEYQLLLARDLGYLSSNQFDAFNTRLTSVKRMLNAFIQKLTANGQRPTANSQ